MSRSHSEMLALSDAYYRVAQDLEAMGRWYLDTATMLNRIADSANEEAMRRAGPLTPSSEGDTP